VSRVLVTGATGFIGRHVPALLEGRDVVAVGSREADLLAPGEAERLIDEVRPTHLLHLAWYAEHGRFWSSPRNADWAEATIRLVRAFRAAGGERAVLAGTCAEYAWDRDEPSHETRTPLVPSTYYGACKHATRLVCEGLGGSFAWGRVFLLFGPHEHPDRLVASVARRLLAGERAPTTAATQVRDLLHVQDVARAFVALLDSDVQGPVNVASGDGRPLRDVLGALAAATGREDLLEVGALPQRPGEPEVLVADATRLREEVGFAPARTLEAGLAETVAWWREQAATVDAR
jgi:nucleoside-diphosphate-sugar epimerase